MRKLQTSDVFACMRLIRRANIREELKPYLKIASSGELNVEDVGIEGILRLIEMFAEKNAEQGIYDVLSGPLEMDVKDIETMELNALIENLTKVAKENDLKTFFTSLVGLISKS